MSSFAWNYALFLAEVVTLVLAAVALVAGIVVLSRRKAKHPGHLDVTDINRQIEVAGDSIEAARLPRRAFKALVKRRKRERSARHQHGDDGSCTYLIDFKGDIRASAFMALREEITAILEVAKAGDEVIVRLESPGGMVNRYGLAAAQLLRLREANLPLTIAVDSIAASGGYLMAATADRIVASPFALVGSIGVVAQIPNFHRWLQARDIDWEQFTAGKYKRTVSLFGKNTDEGREKLREELEEIHERFRAFVHARRPQLDMDRVGTGEAWLGSQALELGLVDELATSDELIRRACSRGRILQLCYQRRTTLPERMRSSGWAVWERLWQLPYTR